jgi:hypothetical protein
MTPELRPWLFLAVLYLVGSGVVQVVEDHGGAPMWIALVAALLLTLVGFGFLSLTRRALRAFKRRDRS